MQPFRTSKERMSIIVPTATLLVTSSSVAAEVTNIVVLATKLKAEQTITVHKC